MKLTITTLIDGNPVKVAKHKSYAHGNFGKSDLSEAEHETLIAEGEISKPSHHGATVVWSI